MSTETQPFPFEEVDVQKWEDAANASRLTHYDNALRNWEANYGRAPGQAPNYNAPPPPEQPAKVHYTYDHEQGLVATEGPDLLGKPYIPPDPGHPPNTVRFGPLIPKLSDQKNGIATYVDNGSTVAPGTEYKSSDGRLFILVEYPDGKRHWVTAA